MPNTTWYDIGYPDMGTTSLLETSRSMHVRCETRGKLSVLLAHASVPPNTQNVPKGSRILEPDISSGITQPQGIYLDPTKMYPFDLSKTAVSIPGLD